MERCPICRGRMNDKAQCKRCGAELCFVIQARNEAENLTQQAIKQIESDEYAKAEHFLGLALALEHSPIRSEMLAFTRHELEKLANSKRKVSFLRRIFGKVL